MKDEVKKKRSRSPFIPHPLKVGYNGNARTALEKRREILFVVEEFDDQANLRPEDRRQHDRARLIVDVYFNGADATGIASTKDISLGGLYMTTQTVLPEGAVLTLRIPLNNDQQVVVNAEVMYSNPGHGVGVRFQGLTEKDRALMERELPAP
jgi:hypothetical protein